MSRKSLVVMALVLALLVTALFIEKGSRRYTGRRSAAAEVRPLPPDFDINAVTGIVLESSSSTTHLDRVEGRWRVREMYGYYADFDRLSSFLRTLALAESSQIVHGGTDRLDDFGLRAESGNSWSRVTLAGGAQPPLPIMIGDPWFPDLSRSPLAAPSGGRYVRVGEGPVLLVIANLYPLPADPKTWIRKQLLNVDPAAVRGVEVKNTNSTYTLVVNGPTEYTLSGLDDPEGIDRGAANRLKRSLQFLRCVAVVDPQKTDADLGFGTNSPLFVLTATNGLVYRVTLGAKDAGGGYYARLSFDFDAPPPPDEKSVRAQLTASSADSSRGESNLAARVQRELARQREAHEQMVDEARRELERLRRELCGWTYVIPLYDYETFTLPRSKLLKKGKEE